jgi:hypothetical protein
LILLTKSCTLENKGKSLFGRAGVLSLLSSFQQGENGENFVAMAKIALFDDWQ